LGDFLTFNLTLSLVFVNLFLWFFIWKEDKNFVDNTYHKNDKGFIVPLEEKRETHFNELDWLTKRGHGDELTADTLIKILKYEQNKNEWRNI